LEEVKKDAEEMEKGIEKWDKANAGK